MLEFDLLWSSSLGVYRLISVLMFLFCNLCVQSLVLFSWAAYCGGCTSLPLPMVATGQEIVREFHFESGKIYIFEKIQGKVKF